MAAQWKPCWAGTDNASLHEVSIARTWRVALSDEPCIAGSEGIVVLTCGQPVWPTCISIQAIPTEQSRKKGVRAGAVRTVTLRDSSKGRVLKLRFPAPERAAQHLVAVAINGVHVLGSPLPLQVLAGTAEASRCTLRGMADGML